MLPTMQQLTIQFITIPEMHHNSVLVAMSFSLLTTESNKFTYQTV